MSHHEHGHDAKVTVFHVTAPTCWWSWGYEAVFNRLPLVYGDQIEVKIAAYCVYNDFDEYLENNGMKDRSEVSEWAKDAAELMGVPLFIPDPRFAWAKSVFPASLATMAAMQQGQAKGSRFLRSMLRQFVVEGKDTNQDEAMDQAAREAGLDLKKFEEAAQDEKKLIAQYEAQGEGMPHLPIGYYNIAVTDGDRRTVIIEHAFEPAEVESAIDWLSGGTLKKRQPTDILSYLKEHGPSPLGELRKVFGLAPEKAQHELDGLAKQGKARSTMLAGAPHWSAI